MRLWICRCISAFVVMGIASVHAADFFFKDGDVVVMIGDSITEQHLYSNYVETWTVTRFPKWKMTFRNVGIGGDTSGGGNSRFRRDVLRYNATAMTVDFGMNDGRYRAFEEATFKPYMDGLQGMAEQAKAANIRTAWVTPQPLDTPDPGTTALVGYNLTLEKFSDGVNVIAEKNAGLFVDQFHPYLEVLDSARGKGPNYQRITGGDPVHPGPSGQVLMAASILKGLSFPTLVSSAEINAATKTVLAAQNCEITNLELQDGVLSFSRLDQALPFFPATAESILPYASVLEELNDYRIKVIGLAAGRYEVRIDGTKITESTSEELAAGVNLATPALAQGPIAEHVKAVQVAVETKNRYHHDSIFRGVVLSNVPGWVDEIFPRDQLDAGKEAIIQRRLKELEALDVLVANALAMKARIVSLVPISQ